MTFLTIGATLCATILGVLYPAAAIVLMIIGALIVVILTLPASKTWVNRIRV
jgi:type IV secretory pathway VirB3-like protein